MADNADHDDRPRKDPLTTECAGPGVPVVGGQIGAYRLLQVLGEGGFATVFLAQQHEPVQRRVALKVMKPGMDSRALIARFEAERQALALLDHPHIARVFDAGTTEIGRPYFVMEYVKGIPVTEHCDRQKLSIEERLRLFIQICEAVQHAHQKGIIHRDIKPSNILVSFDGPYATPKVIDFGIAKAVSQPLTERTLHTEVGQLMGTPEYMSPEQAEMTGQDIDTRSDVYSLGVVLYELLTGSLPFESDTLRSGGLDRVRQVIREQDPRTPSARLKGLSREQSTAVAQCRRTDAAALGRKLRGDLDWITLKAMDKDRARRYGSVGELIADIGRHLGNEPVVAGAPGAIYRARKFVRRNRAFVIGLAAVLVVLVAGVVTTGVFAVRARRQAQTAQAVADFLTRDLLGLVDPNQARGQEVSVRYILDGAAKNLEGKFAEEPHVESSIRKTLGDTYVKLGEWRLAQPHYERVVELHRRSIGEDNPAALDTMADLAQVYLVQVQYDQAHELYARVLEVTRRLRGEGDPATLTAMQQLAYVYTCQGQRDRAESLLKEALETSRRSLGESHVQTIGVMCGLANLYYVQGRMGDALSMLTRALEIQERPGGGHEELTVSLMTTVGFQYAAQGRGKEGRAMVVRALETSRQVFGDEHQTTLGIMSTLGLLDQIQGRPEEAVQLLTEALATSRRVFGPAAPLTLGVIGHLGTVYKDQGRYAEAEPLLLENCEARRQRLGDNHPHTVAAISTLVSLYEAWDKPQQAQTWRAKLPQDQPAK